LNPKLSKIFIFPYIYNKINEFNSITEACLSLNKPGRAGDITAACQGKQKTAFGYIWKYKNNKKIE
jgi:hypothetical protein